MTVILVLATFAIFILLDYVLNRKKAAHLAVAEVQHTIPPALEPAYVEGFLVPEQLNYHPGHGWAFRERRNLVRVGVDEFAAALVGHVDKIEAPKPGQWVRQGQKIWTFYRDGEAAEMVSPTEGEIVEVNQEVLCNPALLREDPYGRGWLAVVHVPDEESTSRNLVPSGLVRSWMREAVSRLYALQPQLAGGAAADGGAPAADLLADLPNANWREVANKFFLTV